MEHGEASSRYALQAQARDSFLLGFFLQPHPTGDDRTSIYGYTTMPFPQFVPISDKGNDLKDRKWGSLDASLSFLEQPTVHIVGSSHGFLLCTTNINENMDYIVCNPVTREYVFLPRPHGVYNCVEVAFTCRRGDDVNLNSSLDEVHYEVVRAGVENPRKQMTILKMETFSSKTGEWRESSAISPSPFKLVLGNSEAIVLEDVIYWKAGSLVDLVAYVPENRCVELINSPPRTLDWCWSKCISQSEGKIHCARVGTHCIEVWVLEDRKKSKWEMKHKVRFSTLIQRNPGMAGRLRNLDLIEVEHIHPWNSKQMLIISCATPFWCDLESGKLVEISVADPRTPVFTYFLYESPCSVLSK